MTAAVKQKWIDGYTEGRKEGYAHGYEMGYMKGLEDGIAGNYPIDAKTMKLAKDAKADETTWIERQEDKAFMCSGMTIDEWMEKESHKYTAK